MTTDDPRRGPMPSGPNAPRPAQQVPPRQAQQGRPPQGPPPQGPPPQARPSLGKQPPPRQPQPPAGRHEQAGSLAYSAVPEPKRPVSSPAPAAPVSPPAPAKESPVTATPTSSTTASAGQSDINYLSIVALVLSGLGITFPFGLWLGYRSRSQIDRDGTIGRQFAVAAIIVAYLWLLALVLGVIAYLWILI
ncbi:DUF4190 domain-containing protein [Gordonia malaquae]|uniref:DUF4190 domain-containing protein n=1 Tax=Gordonia malaquae TaxID=410332 RepID=UPI0030FE4EE0